LRNTSSSLSPSSAEAQLDQALEEYDRLFQEEFERKKALWLKMTQEQRDQYTRTVLDRILKKAKENPLEGLKAFAQLIGSPEGILVWANIWKPEYWPYVAEVTGEAYKLMVKFAVLSEVGGDESVHR